MKIAIVHDWLTVRAGAEAVLEGLLQAYPDADVRTLIYDKVNFRGSPIERARPTPSFVDRLPSARHHHRLYLGLFPFAIEQIDVSDADIVISNTFAVAQGVVTGPDQLHLAYANRTMQYLWETYSSELSGFKFDRGVRGVAARLGLHYIRAWDQLAWQRPDVVIANSAYTQRRLAKHYRRGSEVVSPPVTIPADLDVHAPEDYYITAARLVPLKRIEVLIEAFNRLHRQLLVVGDGPEMSHLRQLAGPTVHFLGWRPKDESLALVASSRAFVTSSVEAFGLGAAEAQCLGVPVVGPESGGLSEIVIPGQTGVLFSPVTVPALIDAINALDALESRLDRRAIAAVSSRLGVTTFVDKIHAVVESSLAVAHLSDGPIGHST